MSGPSSSANRDAYLDLLKRAITNYLYLGSDEPPEQFRCVTHYELAEGRWKIDPLARPLTLLTRAQLDLIESSVLSVHERGVPGDFIEAGVWRGGAIVLMRALLNAYGIEGRTVVAADSFEGIPKNVRAKNDPVDLWKDRWAASLEDVRGNIARFGLLDDRVSFLVGYFADSLKSLAGRQFALMRLDSDSYDSVEESLVYLYPLLSPGGIIIIDDWHLVGCKTAVMNYRTRVGVSEELKVHDGNAFWIKT
ncbi:TylF/MycF/NovP-related O-methyltransferase [Terricaulis sp.]|uniref:TylF/MycF/NovP-related O-methyltransferase n=1 Tax=Terricaulis sp. TaxID=2768686 RepID=UPI002AC46A7A|nr:TylF/MycF/NovP-related O-methyltransferase [Terricaulis sp.]MDZ4691618.1 TylF/MycF/NovP-related O-methyltransferase [Terricaulis sp.]